jgi:hypothetical protein
VTVSFDIELMAFDEDGLRFASSSRWFDGEDITGTNAEKILKRTLEFLEEQIGAHRGKSK